MPGKERQILNEKPEWASPNKITLYSFERYFIDDIFLEIAIGYATAFAFAFM